MKKYIIILSLAVTSLAACNRNVEQIKHFIPGIYVNQAVSKFSMANDTLIIESDNSGDGIYRVTRKTGYRRISNGKPQIMHHQVRRWTGAWDQQKHVLEILQTNKLLAVFPDKGSVLNGNSEYRKL